MATIVFMHCGPRLRLPTAMVRSFRRHNPDFEIIQVADAGSPAIEGVDRVERRKADHSRPMLFRMQCFAALRLSGPAWYLDTDMLCNRPLAYEGGEIPETAVCLREFGVDKPLTQSPIQIDMSRYAGRTMGEAFPFLGCATLLNGGDFWQACLSEMEQLEPDLQAWYGDQEAIRRVVERGGQIGILRERLYACLPEQQGPADRPYINHYKGLRKPQMRDRAEREYPD